MATNTKRTALSILAAGLLATTLQAAPAASSAHAIKPAPKVTVSAKGKVLKGDLQSFRGLATVDRKAVFQAIPAYQQLQKERLSRSDPRYHFLLAEANRVFDRTLERACKHYKVDLIIEDGHVEATGLRVYDLTGPMKKAVAAKRSGSKQR